MALTIDKLKSYQYWVKTDSGYNTATALHKVYTVSSGTDVFSSTAHGLNDGDVVWVQATGTGSALAAPLAYGTDYYVVNN
jgi:hypothetical protein